MQFRHQLTDFGQFTFGHRDCSIANFEKKPLNITGNTPQILKAKGRTRPGDPMSALDHGRGRACAILVRRSTPQDRPWRRHGRDTAW